jgi:hypothetical protein
VPNLILDALMVEYVAHMCARDAMCEEFEFNGKLGSNGLVHI